MEPQEEVWIFGGSRVTAKGARVHAWLPVGADDDLWFKAKGTFTVGSEYTVNVTRSGEKITRHGVPAYRGRHHDQNLVARLETAHRAAETQLRLAALERNDRRQSALDEALEPLCTIIRGVPAPDRDAILVYVMRRLTRSW